MVGCDTAEQAHFLCAVLNSSPARLLVESYSIDTQFSTHIFNLLAIPAFLANNKTHSRLSILSREAHRAAGAADSGKLKSLEGEIDDLVVGFWGLTESDLQEIRYALEES
jgi:hypothetical protein